MARPLCLRNRGVSAYAVTQQSLPYPLALFSLAALELEAYLCVKALESHFRCQSLSKDTLRNNMGGYLSVCVSRKASHRWHGSGWRYGPGCVSLQEKYVSLTTTEETCLTALFIREGWPVNGKILCVCVWVSENCWWLYLNFSMMWDLKWSLAGVEFCECRCVGMCESWRHLISRWTSCAGLRRGQTDGWHRCQSMVTWQHKGWTEGYSVKPSLPWVCVGSLELTHAFILTFCPSTLSSKRFISGLEASSDLVWSWWDLRITWTCLAWWTTLWSSRQYATPFRIRLWIWHFQKCTRLWLIVSWISRKHLSSFLKFWMHFE